VIFPALVPDEFKDDPFMAELLIPPERKSKRNPQSASSPSSMVVEETFPLKCSPKELDEFIGRAGKDAAGWISFYWGKPPEELRRSKEIGDAILLQWLDLFEKRAKLTTK